MYSDFEANLVQIRPRSATARISQGRSLLETGHDGLISSAEHGFFFFESRLISKYSYRINGVVPHLVVASPVQQHSWLGYYLAAPESIGQRDLAKASEEAIELRVGRFIGNGLHEDIAITNFGTERITLEFAIDIDADFADQAFKYVPLKEMEISRSAVDSSIVIHGNASREYHNEDDAGTAQFARGIRVQITSNDDSTTSTKSTSAFNFHISLAPKQCWKICVEFKPIIEGKECVPDYGCAAFNRTAGKIGGTQEEILRACTKIKIGKDDRLETIADRTIRQATQDLVSLRMPDMDTDLGWTLAAGVPIYMGLFGRDTLTAAWQMSLATPRAMYGTLRRLSEFQGKISNDWREESPGKMLHEARTGTRAVLHYDNRERSYGSITTSGFFPVVLAELWHWTGDREFVASIIDSALAALRYLDDLAPRSKSGFYQYLRRSPSGPKHQAWKDSDNAIVDNEGRQVEPPIATCEEQGFIYSAKLLLSEVLWWQDRKDDAKQLFHEAQELKKRFNEHYWNEDDGFIAMGLDTDDKQIRSAASNPGHCLATGITDDAIAKQVAERLMQPDLFNGWGIRTLSSSHPAFNPYSYHLGSVWPVEQATFALGFMRYGLTDLAQTLARGQFEAAGLFAHYRLPEVFAGHSRDAEHPFPAVYVNSNEPQAWSSSAVLCILQSLLQVYPYAPLGTLFIDPHLPEWLPHVELHDLRVASSSVDLRFFRQSDGHTSYDILNMKGSLKVIRQPSPWSLTATPIERVIDLAKSALH